MPVKEISTGNFHFIENHINLCKTLKKFVYYDIKQEINNRKTILLCFPFVLLSPRVLYVSCDRDAMDRTKNRLSSRQIENSLSGVGIRRLSR